MSARVVAAARGWIGTPYVHQASVRGAGADCLGLVRGVWREILGEEPEVPPPYTADWGETGREELLMAAGLRHMAQVTGGWVEGQVLLFRMREGAVAKHLGILSQAGEDARFVHAYDRHGVVESPLSVPWRARVAARFAIPGA